MEQPIVAPFVFDSLGVPLGRLRNVVASRWATVFEVEVDGARPGRNILRIAGQHVAAVRANRIDLNVSGMEVATQARAARPTDAPATE